jgi:hypothetical protein
MERVLPPRKDRLTPLALPPVRSAEDAATAVGAVLTAVAEGRISVGEASAAVELVETCRRMLVPERPEPRPSPLINIAFVNAGESRLPALAAGPASADLGQSVAEHRALRP